MRLQKLQQLPSSIGFDLHGVADIGSVKRRDEDVGLVKLESSDYFLPRFISCSGRHRHARDAGEQSTKITQPQVVTAKIVAPLRHTVGLINSDD